MLGMWLRRIVCLACLTGSFQAAHGQAARADAAARTAAALQRTQAATEVSAGNPFLLTVLAFASHLVGVSLATLSMR